MFCGGGLGIASETGGSDGKEEVFSSFFFFCGDNRDQNLILMTYVVQIACIYLCTDCHLRVSR